jgi:tellurite resistance protein TehA-like permease
MSEGHYEVFSYVVGGVCLVAWIVLLGHLGSLVRNGAPLKKRLQAIGGALFSVIALLVLAAANPIGVYKGEGVVIGAVLTAFGGFFYLTARYMAH